MLVPGWWYVISAESFLDRMTEMPDFLGRARAVWGEKPQGAALSAISSEARGER